jgi:hypothetical protein
MGRVLHIIKNALVQALGGITREEVHPLVIRANILGGLSKKGKFDLKTGLLVVANARIVSRISRELGFYRLGLEGRERCLREVENFKWRGGAILLPASSLQVVDEARSQCLLAKITGPAIGTQLDIQRECVQGTDEEQELQGEK